MVCATLLLAACSSSSDNADVEISRTGFGVVHVRASNYHQLAYGVGYAFAQDNFCTLAEKINQINGERAKHFGATSTVGFGAAATGSVS